MAVTDVRVEPLDAKLGAQVHGLDARAVDPEEAALLRAALTEHHVLFLRDQDLDDDQQRRFAEIWGPLFVDPVSQLLGRPKAVSYIEDNADRAGGVPVAHRHVLARRAAGVRGPQRPRHTADRW